MFIRFGCFWISWINLLNSISKWVLQLYWNFFQLYSRNIKRQTYLDSLITKSYVLMGICHFPFSQTNSTFLTYDLIFLIPSQIYHVLERVLSLEYYVITYICYSTNAKCYPHLMIIILASDIFRYTSLLQSIYTLFL